MSIAQSLLPEVEQEMAGTRKTLERIPEDKFEWRPHPKSFTMIALATHIATMVGWGVSVIKDDSFDLAPPGSEPYREEPAESVAALLATFDKNYAEFREALAGAGDEAMMKDWSLLVGGKVLFTKPRIATLRGDVLNHLVHHRAQLGVYLRLNDAPVPALYGPSADEGGM
ncbi:MAG TPA: DinB family protein [Blastocatellia bacterium]|nr:DinB family protein [Blastocatellia bacterium]